jgi:hypothetical protein
MSNTMNSPDTKESKSLASLQTMLTGVGFFLNSSDTKELGKGSLSFQESTLKSGIHILKQSKAQWAALWIESPDNRRIGLSELRAAYVRLQKEKIRPVLWTFPNADHPKLSSGWIGQCYDALTQDSTGQAEILVILDIEVDFKNKVPRAREFVDHLLALKASRPGLVFGFTSYPFGHPTLPWSEFTKLLEPGRSPVMPQLYTSGGDLKSINRSWAHYQSKFPGCEIVPVVASYIEDFRRLKNSLDLIVSAHLPSAISVWVLKTTDEQEALVLAALNFDRNVAGGQKKEST